MTAITNFLSAQPLFALFATIALGYAVGAVSVKGLSLGAGAVLFVGLAMGAVAPQSALPGVFGSFGLLLFLYGVGISYGAQFFQGLTSPLGLKANAASLIGVLASLGLMFLAMKFVPGVEFAEAIGAFAGAGTSTSALQAAMAVTGDKLPATGYSVAYPFGVAVPILLLGLYNNVIKPKFARPERVSLRVVAVRVENPELVGLCKHAAARRGEPEQCKPRGQKPCGRAFGRLADWRHRAAFQRKQREARPGRAAFGRTLGRQGKPGAGRTRIPAVVCVQPQPAGQNH